MCLWTVYESARQRTAILSMQADLARPEELRILPSIYTPSLY